MVLFFHLQIYLLKVPDHRNQNNRDYKGYDIDNKNRLEKLQNEYANPYGYNLESNVRREIDYDKNATFTNQNMVKNKEYNTK